MIQDIYPSRINISYRAHEITDKDHLFVFNSEGKILLGKEDDKIVFPKSADKSDAIYLFSIGEEKFFLSTKTVEDPPEGFEYYTVREVRKLFSGKEVFAAFTAYHLWRWYADNVFCGRCSAKLSLDERERALRCPECGNVIYPRINPAVIVGVIKDGKLLITRYRTGFAHNALVAGFTEIGETLEDTVAREVMEETGVKVKNIRYYKSQPWGMAQDVLVGFFCEADGDGTIQMDEGELKYAEWVKPEDIELQPDNLSLTNEMMTVFKNGSYKI